MKIPDCIKTGEHNLKPIYNSQHDWDGTWEVVKWCQDCGAIVVDLEVDNITYPGRVAKMEYPEITKEAKI